VVKQATNTGATPLFAAAARGHPGLILLLLEKHADVERAKSDGVTPLHIAVQRAHLESVRLLAERKASVDQERNDGASPMHTAARNGHAEMVHLLLELGAAVDKERKNGTTPLYAAVQYGKTEVARLLLERNAAVDRAQNDGATPLYIASGFGGHAAIASLLLEHGALADQARNDGATPLYSAVQSGHVEIAALLMDHGARADQEKNDSATPLYTAAQSGHTAIIELLLCRGAKADEDIRKVLLEQPLDTKEAEDAETAAVLAQSKEGGPVLKRLGGTPMGARLQHRPFTLLFGKSSTVGSPEAFRNKGVLYYEVTILAALGKHQIGFATKEYRATPPEAQESQPVTVEGTMSRTRSEGRNTKEMEDEVSMRKSTSRTPGQQHSPPRMPTHSPPRAPGHSPARTVSHSPTRSLSHSPTRSADLRGRPGHSPARSAGHSPARMHSPSMRSSKVMSGTASSKGGRTGSKGAVTPKSTLKDGSRWSASAAVLAKQETCVGDDDHSWAVDSKRSLLWHGGQSSQWGANFVTGDVLCLAANVEAGKIAVCRNGNWWDKPSGVVFEDKSIKAGVFPCFSSTFHVVRYNLGAVGHGALAHGPPPSSLWKQTPA